MKNNPAKIENYLKRELEAKIGSLLLRKEVLAITGPRQAGKTTLLLHLYETLKNAGKKILYLTFEKKEELALFQTSIEDFKKLYSNYEVIIIDEFQYVKEGGQKLKYLYDTTKIKFIISGSSSLELTFQTGQYMVGRMIILKLWPFSFREYLSAKDADLHALLEKQIPKNIFAEKEITAFSQPINSSLQKYFEEYGLFGGYPAPAVENEYETKKILLVNILNAYLLKDIKGLLALATDNELNLLTKLLALQIGNLINFKELASGANLAFHQLKKHLNILEETFITNLAYPFFTNKRKELVKTPKSYFIDTGLRNAVINSFNPLSQREDLGGLIENITATHLKRTASEFRPVKFWRTKSGAEVDFILEDNGENIPVEVKYSQAPNVGKSLYSFIDKFSPPRVYVLTRGFTKIQRIGNTQVLFVPVYYL